VTTERTRTRPRLFQAAVDVLGQVLTFEHPADVVLNRYFREQGALGQYDRAFIAESIFGVLRHKRVLDALGAEGAPRRLLLGGLVRFQGTPPADLASVLRRDESEWLARVESASVDELPLAVRAELPDWVYESLRACMDDGELLALGEALQAPAPLDLRVNVLRAERRNVLEALRASGIDAVPTPYSPVGVRIRGKPAINRHPLFLDGSIEVQDEGSQLIGFLVSPKRRELVVDFCAGAGGKSLMLASMMHSQGRLYAFDVSAARLTRLQPRLKRSGLSNIQPHLLASEHDTKVKRLAGKIDRVLVDAPCSGLGTLRRNPDLKWRQSPQAVQEMRAKQAAILRAAASLVKTGGRLVYATCSLLPEENEDIVDAFLADAPQFAELPAGDLLKQQGLPIKTSDRMRLWPHVHGTDGFFAAVLERRGA
jgi:16S rRNA (cytosine967-C5)-methyltransferase